ncbi:hypothetical protein DFH09DRAFT_1183536, partial [Mycena vulgaris]
MIIRWHARTLVFYGKRSRCELADAFNFRYPTVTNWQSLHSRRHPQGTRSSPSPDPITFQLRKLASAECHFHRTHGVIIRRLNLSSSSPNIHGGCPPPIGFGISVFCLLLLLPSLSITANSSDEQKFLSASSLAVVGASNNESKVGTMVLKALLAKGMSAVPINPFVAESQGITTLDSLSDLPHPTQTSISIVTLQILKQAHDLGVFAVWLQPGAQDAAMLEYLANSSVTAQGTYIYTS